MVLASGIVRVSAELKSLSVNHKKNIASQIVPKVKYQINQHNGLSAELAVVKLLINRDWKLIFHRLKTKKCEVDLIFEQNESILIVEVKVLTENWRVFQRVSEQQINRLKNIEYALRVNFKKYKIKSYIAWVDQKNNISFCSLS